MEIQYKKIFITCAAFIVIFVQVLDHLGSGTWTGAKKDVSDTNILVGEIEGKYNDKRHNTTTSDSGRRHLTSRQQKRLDTEKKRRMERRKTMMKDNKESGTLKKRLPQALIIGVPKCGTGKHSYTMYMYM